MQQSYNSFMALDANAKKQAHIRGCQKSLLVWNEFVEQGTNLSYRDSVLCMKHPIEIDLPKQALQAVIDNEANNQLSKLYMEPIVALQDMDWQLPEHLEFAYYSIYNLYRKYCEGMDIDDWLIINQCLSAQTSNEPIL